MVSEFKKDNKRSLQDIINDLIAKLMAMIKMLI